jgi:hypothetical protein
MVEANTGLTKEAMKNPEAAKWNPYVASSGKPLSDYKQDEIPLGYRPYKEGDKLTPAEQDNNLFHNAWASLKNPDFDAANPQTGFAAMTKLMPAETQKKLLDYLDERSRMESRYGESPLAKNESFANARTAADIRKILGLEG